MAGQDQQRDASVGLSAVGANMPTATAAVGPSAMAGVSSDRAAPAIHKHATDIEGAANEEDDVDMVPADN